MDHYRGRPGGSCLDPCPSGVHLYGLVHRPCGRGAPDRVDAHWKRDGIRPLGAETDPNAKADCHSAVYRNTYAQTHSHTHTESHGHTQAYRYANTQAYSDGQAHSHADARAHGDTQTNRHAYV